MVINSMNDEKILVTGGTGFIGSHLVEALVKRGYKVRCLVREKSDVKHLKDLGVELVYGDICDENSLKNAVQGVSVVFHLAGILGRWGVPKEVYWDIHVKGTENLLKACIENGVKRIIYCSSAGVLGPIEKPPADESYPYNPSNIYEKTKAEAEKAILNCKEKLEVTVIRPEFVYGPRDMHVLRLFDSIQKGRFFIIGDGESLLHPTYIDDLIQGFLLCLENEESIGEIYLITGETPVKVRDLVAMIAEELGVSPPKIHVPKWLAYMAAILFESASRLFNFEPPITLSQVKFFTQHRAFDYSKAKSELGYCPINLKKGIRKTVSWYRKNGYLLENNNKKGYMSFEIAYQLATAEGEGIGTAYEYLAKQRVIIKAINQFGSPKNVLIAGLPEKYGYSLDFVYFCKHIGADAVVADERKKKLKVFAKIFSKLKKQRFFTNTKLTLLEITNWSDISFDSIFDFAISCEVIQRLDIAERAEYVRSIGKIANNIIFFVPNAENAAHAKISKLRALKLDELKKLCMEANYKLISYGYIDMPPFPPGLKQKKMGKFGISNMKMNFFFKILLIAWSILERKIPPAILKKQSHMIYFVGKSTACSQSKSLSD